MTIRYLKDVSSLLALVSAVCEKNLERQLQVEREMLTYCFAFGHINYARYLSYQQFYLTPLEANNSPAVSNIWIIIHGDLVTEIFNGQTKRQTGPHGSGFSTNIDTVLILTNFKFDGRERTCF